MRLDRNAVPRGYAVWRVRVGAGIPIDEFPLECPIDQDGECASGRGNVLRFANPQGQAPAEGTEAVCVLPRPGKAEAYVTRIPETLSTCTLKADRQWPPGLPGIRGL
jgi:hypothetical protein